MLNVIALNGRLTAVPELKTTPSGVSVCSFSVAVDRNQKNKDGEKITDFINIVTWRSTAEFVSKYFTKSKMIAIQGELQTRKFTDKAGTERTIYEVNATQVSFCGDSKPAQAKEQQQQTQAEPFEEVTVTDDDLPF